jgi:2-polyprenyl-3-methyl-5-hydroxy-6-metoxy-1,4-benzoquinol methylase
MISVVEPLPALMRAFREGGGVPYTSFGADCRDGIAAGNRVQFINLLGRDWLPAIPELDARLRSQPAATIADIGCGFGWSTISIARAYPLARIDAFDLDDTSIAAARGNAREAGVEERIRFEVGDAAELTGGQRYDLVVAFETIHDMARPVDALKTMRELTKPNGFVLVVDENVGDRFSVDPGDVERLYYGFSVLHCLPASMAEQPSAGTGTVMRASTLQRYAREAGFREVTVLPIAHDFWRFYQLIA